MNTLRITIVAALSLSACATSTRQQLPSDVVPEKWEVSRSSTVAVSGTETSTRAAWWASFDDPVLRQMIDTAKSRNLDIRIADARIREARAVEGGAGAALFPELTASAGASVSKSQRAELRSRFFQLGLAASWEVDVFGRLRSAERATVAEREALVSDRAGVELLLLADVAETYVDYRLRRLQHTLSVKTAEAQARTVAITQARFEQGVANRFDVERALAALAVTRARVPLANEQAATARYRLAVLLADTPEAISTWLGEDRPLPGSDAATVLTTPTEVVGQRPDVLAAEWRLWAALARRDAAQALRYPRLTLNGLLGLENRDIKQLLDPVSVVWSLGAGLFSPLFDFGRIRAQIDATDARQQQAYLVYERTVRIALQEAQTAIYGYAQGVLRQQELGVAVKSASKAAELARLQYKEGTLSLLEVLDAERSLIDAELSWSQATADVSVRLIRMHRTLGG